MAKQVLNLKFASSLTSICEVNSSFDKGVLRIAYEGDNRNKSSISHESFMRALPSIACCPVVANYSVQEDSIGGHDMGLVKCDDGDIRFVNFTQPVGVVPESARQWFEEVDEEDGSVHNYLYTDILLWKRQAAYSKIKRDGIVSQSMEITVKDGEKIDGIYHIKDFEFTAFCLLGDDKEPCFESSELEVFSADSFKKELFEMMQDLKDSYTNMVDTSNDVVDIHPQKISTEGGETVLDKKHELIAEYGIDVDSLDFSIDELTEEELKEKLEAMKFEAESKKTPDEEPAPEEGEKEDFALVSGVIKELSRCVCNAAEIDKPWGKCPKYEYIDADVEASEVFVIDCEDWLLYGFTYTVNGDSVNVDFNSKKRKKYAIVDFEGEQESPVAAMFAKAEQVIKDNAEWEAKFNTASDTIASMESELNELRQFKADIEAADAEAKRESLFENFADLDGNEAFEALKENCKDMDIETIEEKCFAIRGRSVARFDLEQPKKPKIKIDRSESKPMPYGGIVEEYRNKFN